VIVQNQPVLVLPRPGSSTGTEVSSANNRAEASRIAFIRRTTGAISAAPVPTQAASVARSTKMPWRARIPAWR
jgi:hypothetical protein